MPPSESGQTDTALACLAERAEFDFGAGYKCRVCKFCRVPSWAKSPLPSGIFSQWDPLMPWQNGKRDRPLGQLCRICVLVMWIHLKTCTFF